MFMPDLRQAQARLLEQGREPLNIMAGPLRRGSPADEIMTMYAIAGP